MPTTRSALCVGAVLLALSSYGRPLQAQNAPDARRSLLGVVRSDGVLVPVASRDRDMWTGVRTFDATDDGLFRIRDLDVFPRGGWRSTSLETRETRATVLGRLTTTDAFCNRQEGFVIARQGADASGSPPPDAPPRIVAVSLHGDLTFTFAEDVSRSGDAETRRAAAFVERLAHATEDQRVAASAAPPLPTVGRERVAVEITTLVRHRVPPADDSYYFEAQKRYGRTESYVNGWILSSPLSLRILRVNAGIDRGGETARRRGRPLGIVRAGPETAWVMHMRAYEGESFDIVDMSGQVLSVHAGGC